MILRNKVLWFFGRINLLWPISVCWQYVFNPWTLILPTFAEGGSFVPHMFVWNTVSQTQPSEYPAYRARCNQRLVWKQYRGRRNNRNQFLTNNDTNMHYQPPTTTTATTTNNDTNNRNDNGAHATTTGQSKVTTPRPTSTPMFAQGIWTKCLRTCRRPWFPGCQRQRCGSSSQVNGGWTAQVHGWNLGFGL